MAAFIDGQRQNIGINRGVRHTATIASSGNTPLTSIRLPETFKSRINHGSIKLNYISCAVEHTKPVRFNFYANATLTGASFSAIDTDSCVQQDTSATAISGGVYLFSVLLGKSSNQIVSLVEDLNIGLFHDGDMLTVTAEYDSGTNAEVSISINFTERL